MAENGGGQVVIADIDVDDLGIAPANGYSVEVFEVAVVADEDDSLSENS